jgi:hypothetical protein
MGRDCRKIFLSMTALLLFPLTALCAATPPEIVSALAAGNLVAFQQWNAGPNFDHLLSCALIGPSDPDAKLVIYDGNTRVLSFVPGETPDSMFLLDGNLVTIWESGDGSPRVAVFAYANGKVASVLYVSSFKIPAEFAYQTTSPGSFMHDQGDKVPGWNWTHRIIIPKGEWSSSIDFEPRTADVYEWDGAHYRQHKNVRWTDRFKPFVHDARHPAPLAAPVDLRHPDHAN